LDEWGKFPLFLHGFFYHMLSTPNADFKPSKKRPQVVRDLNKQLVVALDEFRSFGKDNDRMMQLKFSVLRALGFKLVLLGSNSSAANLVQMNQQNKGCKMFDSCSIFPRLPKFKLDALTLNLDSDQNSY
jgi:hypothetical protein